jgi:hypothetical protein
MNETRYYTHVVTWGRGTWLIFRMSSILLNSSNVLELLINCYVIVQIEVYLQLILGEVALLQLCQCQQIGLILELVFLVCDLSLLGSHLLEVKYPQSGNGADDLQSVIGHLRNDVAVQDESLELTITQVEDLGHVAQFVVHEAEILEAGQ